MHQPLSPIDHVSYLEQQSDRKFKKKIEYYTGDIQKSPNKDCESTDFCM
mgnify:CR=1 FL=1